MIEIGLKPAILSALCRSSHPISGFLHRTTYGSVEFASCQASQISYSINSSRKDLLPQGEDGECRSVVGPDLRGFFIYRGQQ